MTVTALYAVKTCTVFFTDWDGTALKTQEVNYGEAAEAPQAPSREGYTFTGWSGDYTNVTESRILMAQYERLSFTVRFVDYDGTELSSQSVFWGEAAQHRRPRRARATPSPAGMLTSRTSARISPSRRSTASC